MASPTAREPTPSRRSVPPAEPGSWLLRFGGAVAAGAVGSAVAVVPAALRLKPTVGACGPVGAWPLLFGVVLAPMILAVVTLRRARASMRGFDRGDGVAPAVLLLAWGASCFVAMTVLGAVLRARTHHRALAGVSFALGACVLAIGLAVTLLRVASLLRKASATARWTLAAVAAAALGFAAAVVRHRTPPFSVADGARLVDGLALVLAAFLASSQPLLQRRALALVGPPVAAVVLILAWSSWSGCPGLAEALDQRAPLFAWMARHGPLH